MKFHGIIFDFDGVLLESEYEGNRHLAELLSELGHPTSIEDALTNFVGLSGRDFHGAIERWIGRPLPPQFHIMRAEEDGRVLREGLAPVAGAVEFVRSLPADLPKAVASSSTSHWVATHLDHLGVLDAFGQMIFSGREHVARGKPAPDLYLHAADALRIDIRRTLVIEDSPVGVTGAVASGAYVAGLCAGSHCGEGHADRLRQLGADVVAASFAEIAAILI